MLRSLAIVRLLAILVFVCSAGGVMAETAAPKPEGPDLSARAFTGKVAAGLAAKMPDRKFTVTGEFLITRTDPDGGEATLSVGNLYRD
jgi:hypothetical protein